MKKAALLLPITFSTITLFASSFTKPLAPQSSYDMPTKCSDCGEWHIAGTPCRR